MAKRLAIPALLGTAIFLTAVLFVLAGCGGSGGPVVTPPDTGPSVSKAFLALLPAGQTGATYVGATQCITCHSTKQGDAEPVDSTMWADTKHAQLSIGCEQCHGPGSKHNANPTEDNILTFPKITRSEVCAQCHGPKASDFATSPHAGYVEDEIETTSPSKTCFRCHSGSFRTEMIDAKLAAGKTPAEVDSEILALTSAQMLTYANDPATHTGGTKESETCSGCHNPHKKTGILLENVDHTTLEVQLTRPPFSSDTSKIQPGTSVANYTTVDHLCGCCHNSRGGGNSDAYLAANTSRKSFHNGQQFNMLLGQGGYEPSAPTTRTSAHADIPSQCSKCHLANGSHTFTVSVDQSCNPCHTPQDAQARMAIRSVNQLRLYNIKTRLETWAKATFGDKNVWDYTSNIVAPSVNPGQGNIPAQIKGVRHNYWYVLIDKSFGIHNTYYTSYLLDVCDQLLDAVPGTRAATVKPTKQQLEAFARSEIARDLRATRLARE